MTKASDNAFPSILITEATEPSAPAAGKQRLYIDSTTHLLKATNSSGTDRTIEGVAAGAITSSGLTMATARLLGRTTSSTGAVEEITVGTGLSLSAGALTATGGSSGMVELDYVQFTSDVSISATTSAGANTVVTANAVAFDGSTVVFIEFFAIAETGSGGNLYAVLYDGSTELGQMTVVTPGTGVARSAGVIARRLTPSNATHTYSIRGFRDTANGKWRAGDGTATNFMPGYIRIVTKG